MASNKCLVFSHNLSVSEMLLLIILEVLAVAGDSVKQTAVLPRLAKELLSLLLL